MFAYLALLVVMVALSSASALTSAKIDASELLAFAKDKCVENGNFLSTPTITVS